MKTTTTKTLQLLTPATLGDLELANRMIFAPLTRSRAGEGNYNGSAIC